MQIAAAPLAAYTHALLRGDVFLMPLMELKEFQNSDFTVVLQKLVEDRKRLGKGSCLGNYSKDLVDEDDPFSDGSFLHSYYLSFAYHVHNLIASYRSSSRVD